MRRIRYLLYLMAALLGAGAAAVTPPAGEDVAFVGAHVIPMTVPWTHDDYTVIVRDGVIAAVGPSAELEPAATDRVIDARGRVLMPGLAEMHAHVPPPAQPNLPAGYQQDVLLLWVANGVTLARGMLGQPQHLELREQLLRHEVLGPRLITSGPSFNGRTVTSPAQARARVAAQAAAGYDFLKMHPGLSRADFDAEAFLAARKALIGALHRGGIPILLGSDSPQIGNVPGFALHRELEAMVAAGLHPMEALAAGTSNPARFFGEEGRQGVIAQGAEANLVLLRRNPIVDIDRTREIDGVMVRGRWLDRAFLDAALEDVRRRYAEETR